jgi:hypothetical protein
VISSFEDIGAPIAKTDVVAGACDTAPDLPRKSCVS